MHLLRSDGTVWWIDVVGNKHQQIMSLGKPLTEVVSVATGERFGCAVRSAIEGGSVWCWLTATGAFTESFPYQGQLGDGKVEPPTAPHQAVQVVDKNGPLKKAAKVRAGYSNACAIMQDASVLCWGANAKLQLGAGIVAGSSNIAVVPLNKEGIPVEMASDGAMGVDHLCLLTTAKAVWCVGNNAYGQLAQPHTSTESSVVQVKFPGDRKVISLATSENSTYVVTEDGLGWVFGSTLYHLAGINRPDPYAPFDLHEPTPIRDETGKDGTQLAHLSRIAGGHRRTCAITTASYPQLGAGQPVCWGNDYPYPILWTDPYQNKPVGPVWLLVMNDYPDGAADIRGPGFVQTDGSFYNGKGDKLINLSCP
jgi:alpha-tubulin suppressor-like RCC1 family protein